MWVCYGCIIFFFKQKTAYEMRISDWSSDVCSSDLPSTELPRVLLQLSDSLKPGGVLFCSNPRGQDQEGWSGDRYGVWYAWPTWRERLLAAGFVELEIGRASCRERVCPYV